MSETCDHSKLLVRLEAVVAVTVEKDEQGNYQYVDEPIRQIIEEKTVDVLESECLKCGEKQDERTTRYIH